MSLKVEKKVRKTVQKMGIVIATFVCVITLMSVYGANKVPVENDRKITKEKETGKPKEDFDTVVYDMVEIRKYDGEDGYEYIHHKNSNHTEKTIVKTERGMLGYDKEGKPLSVAWNFLDSSKENSYLFVTEDETQILPGETDTREEGGWTLYDGIKMNGLRGSEPNKVVYVLYCDKKITFEDGTVWTNPDYEQWVKNYEGKPIDVEVLKNYYPAVEKIIW